MTEFEVQNAGNGISRYKIFHLWGGGGMPPDPPNNARYWNQPQSRYEAGSAPGENIVSYVRNDLTSSTDEDVGDRFTCPV